MDGARIEAGIVFVFPVGLTLGGVNIWSCGMVRELHQRGLRVCTIEHRSVDWAPRMKVTFPGGVQRMSCGGKGALEGGCFSRMIYRNVYRRAMPGIYVPNYSDASYRVCAELRRRYPKQVRVIGVAHGDSDAYYEPLLKYAESIDVFVGVNQRIAEHLVSLLPNRARDVFCRSCPVEVGAFPERDYARRGRPLTMTYAGRLTNHEKRVSNLAPLAAKLAQRNIAFKMRIVGDGGYKKTLEAEVSSLETRARDNISVEGVLPPEDMQSVWRTSDICLLVSDCEGTPLTLLESMASGCVPVVPDLPGIRAVIEHGRNGYLYRANDMDAAADVLCELDKNRDIIPAIGRCGWEKVKESYSYQSYIPWFLSVVEAVAGPCAMIQRGQPG